MSGGPDTSRHLIEPKIHLVDGRVIGSIAEAIALVREHESRRVATAAGEKIGDDRRRVEWISSRTSLSGCR